MTALQLRHGPWAEPLCVNIPGRDHAVVCDTPSRRDRVRSSTDPEWLQAVIRDQNTQLSVRALATSRLRRVRRESK